MAQSYDIPRNDPASGLESLNVFLLLQLARRSAIGLSIGRAMLCASGVGEVARRQGSVVTGLQTFILFLAFITLLGAMGPRWRSASQRRSEHFGPDPYE